MEHYKDPGNMAYSRDEKSFPARVMTTFWISVPFKTRMSLLERTRPGLGIIEPCLPSPAKVPPSGPGWLHEIKHDGFRILARRDLAGVRAEFGVAPTFGAGGRRWGSGPRARPALRQHCRPAYCGNQLGTASFRCGL